MHSKAPCGRGRTCRSWTATIPACPDERELIDQGQFANETEARAWVHDLETLHEDPSREDLAAKRGIGPTLLDADLRRLEVRNWLEAVLVSPARGC